MDFRRQILKVNSKWLQITWRLYNKKVDFRLPILRKNLEFHFPFKTSKIYTSIHTKNITISTYNNDKNDVYLSEF